MRTTFKKRSLILVLVLLTAITFFSLKQEAQASVTWYYTLTIGSVGPDQGIGIMMLSGASLSKAWYYCRNDQLNAQLATAYTAISLGKTVSAYIDTSTNIIQAITLDN